MALRCLLLCVLYLVCTNCCRASAQDLTTLHEELVARIVQNDVQGFITAVQATEEAIVNAMVAAETMTGINGNTIYALPTDRLKTTLRRYNRMKE